MSTHKKKELGFVRPMFDAIAPRYDFLNRLLSLRQDVYWRRRMVKALDIPQDGRVLDVACGTGDVMTEVLKQNRGRQVIGIDFARKMLAIAGRKIVSAYPGADCALVSADALAPPFADDVFHAVTIAFGIRNIVDRQRALSQFRRVLKPGGMLAVLELATPPPGFIRSLYLLYFQKILPGVGGLFSKNIRAYHYLPDSVLNFPRPAQFAELMRTSGFVDVRWKSLTAGVATLYVGNKPQTHHQFA